MHQFVLAINIMIVFLEVTLLAVGPLGYNGSKAAMELISKADVVLSSWYKIKSFFNTYQVMEWIIGQKMQILSKLI